MKKTWAYIKEVFFTLGVILGVYEGYDILFSQLRLLQGTLVEEIFVPARGAGGGSKGEHLPIQYFVHNDEED